LILGLAKIRTEVTEVERTTPSAAGRTERVRAEVDRIATEYLAGTPVMTTDALSTIARRYESVRAREPPSPDGTGRMNLIMNEARVRARAAPDLAADTGRRLLMSTADGDRVIGLALLQQEPRADALAEILRIVQSSRSAFEQYHAV